MALLSSFSSFSFSFSSFFSVRFFSLMSDERVQRQKKWKLEMGSMSIALEVIMGVRIVKTPAEKEDDDWSVRAGLEECEVHFSCIC